MNTKYYVFHEKTGKCYILDEEIKHKTELEVVDKNACWWKYKHNNANLTIEKLGRNRITARLETSREIKDIVLGWEEEDRGRAVWDEEKKDYVLKYGLPKIFYLFRNNHRKRTFKFNFIYPHHLILKDKDEHKPYYWYYYDYSEELGDFIYETLKWFIKPEQGEIVEIPGEQGQAVYPWREVDYLADDYHCGEDEEYQDYNFATETAENWKKENGPTSLVITFLPTYFKNYELKRGQKLTGTTWFKKIWEVWGSRGIPIVVKCYRSWVYINLYRHYRTLYDQISSITELPTCIDDREVGKSNLLVYFNMPFLNKKTPYIV